MLLFLFWQKRILKSRIAFDTKFSMKTNAGFYFSFVSDSEYNCVVNPMGIILFVLTLILFQ